MNYCLLGIFRDKLDKCSLDHSGNGSNDARRYIFDLQDKTMAADDIHSQSLRN